MLENQATENTEVTPWAKATIEHLKNSAPVFASKEQAIVSFTKELNQIAANRAMTAEQLLAVASSSIESHEDFNRALRLSSMIFAFKKL